MASHEDPPPFARWTEPLLRLPCWGVQQGYSSFLTLEFGEPYLSIRNSTQTRPDSELPAYRSPRLKGEWHLWIYCCGWTISQDDERLADYESPDPEVAAACGKLEGQMLSRVAMLPETGQSVLAFDLGGRIDTEPFDTDLLEQWHLFGPGERCFTYRSDGSACLSRSDTPPDERRWSRPQ